MLRRHSSILAGYLWLAGLVVLVPLAILWEVARWVWSWLAG